MIMSSKNDYRQSYYPRNLNTGMFIGRLSTAKSTFNIGPRNNQSNKIIGKSPLG